MDIFSIDLTKMEIAFIRQALDVVSITGKDAKFLAGLQLKLEREMIEIEKMLNPPPPPIEDTKARTVKK
jgi:hypothetical protein